MSDALGPTAQRVQDTRQIQECAAEVGVRAG
jgi:hypothetical protein